MPNAVPDEWVTRYRNELRAQRHDQLARAITGIAQSSRRDAWVLLVASGLCVVLLLVAPGRVATFAGPSGMSVGSVMIVAAFGTCLWLVHGCRKHLRSEHERGRDLSR